MNHIVSNKNIKTFLFLMIIGVLSMKSNVVVNLSLAVISTPNDLSYLQLFSLSLFQILLISMIIYFIFSKLIRNYFYQNNQIPIDFRQIILSKWPSIILILSIYLYNHFNLINKSILLAVLFFSILALYLYLQLRAYLQTLSIDFKVSNLHSWIVLGVLITIDLGAFGIIHIFLN